MIEPARKAMDLGGKRSTFTMQKTHQTHRAELRLYKTGFQVYASDKSSRGPELMLEKLENVSLRSIEARC